MAGRKKNPELKRESIIAKAIELADSIGIEALTIRKLAIQLEAGAMSIYHYFQSKEEIIDGMIDEIFGEISLPSEGTSWKEEIRKRCRSARTVLVRHPWAAGYMESRKNPGSMTLRHHNAVIGCFLSAGFPMELTSQAVAIVDSFVFGFSLQETTLPGGGGEEMVEMGREMKEVFSGSYPHLFHMTEYVLNSQYRFGDSFETGLDIVLAGLEAKL